MFSQTDVKFINTIRTLAADITYKSQSGHPGAPMGLAPVAEVLWQYYLNFNPKNPQWFNRDRFLLSNGHAVALQYILLHLYGYDMSMDDLKHFRQLDSKTPGHPEFEIPGVECTTGPLGQGVGNAVGMAIAAHHLAATFNRPNFDIIDNYIYCFLGDGCLQEGVASEAMSLAGHLQLDRLIFIYDDNHISIDGDVDVAFTENVLERMKAYGFETFVVSDGDTDLKSINEAIEKAKQVKGKPSFIKNHTTIGYGSLIQGTHSVHGSPLKEEDIKHLKKLFGFNPDETFVVPTEVQDFVNEKVKKGEEANAKWDDLFAAYKKEYPKEASELERRIKAELPANWEKALPTYKPSDKAVASRKLSEIVLNDIHDVIPELVGGSADLTGSNLTRWEGATDLQPPNTKLGNYGGRYIRYGVREHGMGAVMNGMAAFGGIIPYGGTFLNFVSYAAGAVRLSALSGHHVIWIATHDSIGLGEDGPTHQPIETLAHLRAIPNLMVWRPADGNETSAAYKVALERKDTPTVMALSRQNLPQLEGSSIEKASKGGYVVYESEKPQVILASTGSEVSISVDAAKVLKEKGISASVVSLPDFFTFNLQDEEYKLNVFPDHVPAMSVEVLSAFGWDAYTHEHFNLDHFGASGKYTDIYKALEFTPEGIAKRAEATVEFYKGVPVRSRIRHAFKHLEQFEPGPFRSVDMKHLV